VPQVATNTTDQGRDTWPGFKAGTYYYLEINATAGGVSRSSTPPESISF